MTHDEYNALPGLRASHIKQGTVSMLAMRYAVEHERPDTTAFAFGRLVHLAVFEPTRLADVAVWRGGRRAGAEYAAWVAENEDREQCRAEDMDLLAAISDSVRANAEIGAILAGCTYETCAQWAEGEYGPAKCRFDAVGPRRVVDLKTIAKLSERAINAAFWRYSYHLQIGWYCEGYLRTRGENADAWIVWAEKSPPYDCVVQKVGFDVLDFGQREALRIAARYRRCEERHEWPGLQSDITALALPTWLQDDAEKALFTDDTEDE